MSMLDGIRKGTDSTLFRVLIGGVLFLFIFWGAGSSRRGGDGSIVATVNGTSITDSDFKRIYRQTLRAAGNGLTEEQEAGLAAEVRDQLIKEEAMVQEAIRLGFYVSDEEIKRTIVNDDSFQGADKKFDEKLFRKRLKSAGFTEGQYENLVRRGLLVVKLTEFMAGSVVVGDKETWEFFKEYQSRVEVQYVRISNSALMDFIEVSDADRDAFIASSKDKIETRYKEDYDRFYNLPKRYQLKMILVKTQTPEGVALDEAAKKDARARAEAALIRARAGADFSELAKEVSEDITGAGGGGLGIRPGSQFDPAEVAAADKAGVGQLTEVIETPRGFELLLVEKIEEPKLISLEEATFEIATKLLKSEQVNQTVKDYAQSLITAWTPGSAPPPELLAQYSLAVESTGEISLASPDIKKPEIRMIAENEELWKQVQAATGPTVFPSTFTMGGSTYVVAIASRTEPSEAEFEAQKGMFRTQLLRERQKQFAENWAQSVVASAKVELPETQ
jgi:peptidyl-prolyl cis-trans isomerase D